MAPSSNLPRVLIVDDEQLVVSVIRRTLGHKFDTESASNGAEALEKIKADGPFDVVMSDMQMPLLTGLELAKKAAEVAPQTRFVLLSGNQDAETVEEVRGVPTITSFLQKPCSREEIAAAIESACASASPAG